STDVTVPGRASLFTDFSRKPDLSGGKVVFGGSFSGGSGVYQANLDGSGLIKLVESGSQIPGTNVNFTSIQNAAVELGTVVFIGIGSGINGAYRLQNGAFDKIIAKPDLLDGKTVDQVLLSNQGLSGGRLALHIVLSN